MTLDRMSRANAMEVMRMFYELEEQVSIREHNIYVMKENLKKFNPKKTGFGSLKYVVKSYLRASYFSVTLILIAAAMLGIFYTTEISEPVLLSIAGALVVADIIVYILISKAIKKKNLKKVINQNKDEYNYWISQINNDISELNVLKPAIADEYKKYNVAPEYRSYHAMCSMYTILYHHSAMSVLDAMKKYDEDERARRIAEAQREAGERVSNAIAEESRKTRDTINENARRSQEINSAILGKLNDFYYYR